MKSCDYYKINSTFRQSKEIHGRQVIGFTYKIPYCSHHFAGELALNSVSKGVTNSSQLICEGDKAKCQLAEKHK